MKFRFKSKHSKGFSLMEMLVVIAILGILASMALIAFGPTRQGAVDAKDRRNAQEIATIAATASAAGAQYVVPNNEEATILNLVEGRAPTTGAFKGRVFKVPLMAETDVQGAMRFLALENTQLRYNQPTQ